MPVFLDRLAATIGADGHVAIVLDPADRRCSGALRKAGNITLVPLPLRSPALGSVGCEWLSLDERIRSHRLLADYDAIADAACTACIRLCAEAGRRTSLCSYPWIAQAKR